ncbi:hypothetical protein QBC36DRAFT_127535 [Triangularia setosa]|uniref:Uncharacterized protein n=1 Tax=Triangularia setosa TaxID=2587417 RepID=A0AAN7A853_9PEZI|nr:hypothetical protein QBC36DRAFT_127535 [Podospora setosa]
MLLSVMWEDVLCYTYRSFPGTSRLTSHGLSRRSGPSGHRLYHDMHSCNATSPHWVYKPLVFSYLIAVSYPLTQKSRIREQEPFPAVSFRNPYQYGVVSPGPSHSLAPVFSRAWGPNSAQTSHLRRPGSSGSGLSSRQASSTCSLGPDLLEKMTNKRTCFPVFVYTVYTKDKPIPTYPQPPVSASVIFDMRCQGGAGGGRSREFFAWW